MLLSPSSNTTSFNAVQIQYSLLVDYQYYAVKKVEKWIYGFYLYFKRARFNVFNFYLVRNPSFA